MTVRSEFKAFPPGVLSKSNLIAHDKEISESPISVCQAYTHIRLAFYADMNHPCFPTIRS
eukprot:759900-Hanusia_phi.AAC.1